MLFSLLPAAMGDVHLVSKAERSPLFLLTREASLPFSPRGEAKWVRGSSGRGASCLARAGVLDRTLSTASKRNEVLVLVSRASTVGW